MYYRMRLTEKFSFSVPWKTWPFSPLMSNNKITTPEVCTDSTETTLVCSVQRKRRTFRKDVRITEWATTSPQHVPLNSTIKHDSWKVFEVLTGSFTTLAMKIHTRPRICRWYNLNTVLATWRTSVIRRSTKHHSTLVYMTNLHYVSWPLL
jgi:hypothetical protein